VHDVPDFSIGFEERTLPLIAQNLLHHASDARLRSASNPKHVIHETKKIESCNSNTNSRSSKKKEEEKNLILSFGLYSCRAGVFSQRSPV
jgi:hypothetical protein